jgi:hypothetical protein
VAAGARRTIGLDVLLRWCLQRMIERSEAVAGVPARIFLALVAAREPAPPSAPHVPTNHRLGFAVLISMLAEAR